MERMFLSLSLALIVSFCNINHTYAWKYQETTYVLPYEEGMGTEDYPYIIKTEQQLADLSYYVNLGSSFDGAYFALGNDLDFNPGFVFNSDGSITGDGTPQEWTPIGCKDTPFKGNFDGRGHTIRGLYMKTPVLKTNSLSAYYGLFIICENSTISDLNIDNSMFLCNVDGSIDISRLTIGFISSGLETTDDNRPAKVEDIKVNGTIIITPTNNTTIEAGMLLGYCMGTIKGCESHGLITTAQNIPEGYNYIASIGGLCGTISSSSYTSHEFELSNCTNHADIYCPLEDAKVGGICSWNTSYCEVFPLDNLINYGDITSGGAAGLIYIDGGHPLISSCYNYGIIHGVGKYSDAAGLFQTIHGQTVRNCHNMGNVINESQSCGYSGGLVGYSDGDYVFENCSNKGNIMYGSGILGGGPYNGDFISCTNEGDITGEGGIAGDIFSGMTTFKNCVNSGNVIGTGKYTGGIAARANPRMEGCANYGGVQGEMYVGGLLGGTLGWEEEECISQSHNTGNISANYAAGGILAEGYSCKISQCYNTANIDVSVLDNKGNVCLGGIAAQTSGSIDNVYNIGNVSILKDVDFIDEEKTNNSRTCGGLIGSFSASSSSTISNAYNIGEVKSALNSYVGNIIGYRSIFYDVFDANNIFYIPTEDMLPIGNIENNIPAGIVAKTTEEFANGSVCVLLNEGQDPAPWGQEIGVDASPVLNGKGNPESAGIEILPADNGDAFAIKIIDGGISISGSVTTVNAYNIDGICVYSGGTGQVALAPGFYILRITNINGQTSSAKLMVK